MFPLHCVALECVFLIIDPDMIDVNLTNYPAFIRNFDRVFDRRARARLVGIFPREQTDIPQENLSSITKEIDTKIRLMRIALDTEPACDATLSLFEIATTALLTLPSHQILPTTTALAGIERGQLLINRYIRGIALVTLNYKAVFAPYAWH
ncbi:Uncharacterised protein [Mycobacteroides abscessus subsp. bolletii]|nr:Uncharacterised protein [Mycobacteroides abscessus subsp. bolletii]SIJ69083.1 Uncharacterised protein [Mycobacteroides abscessus subsp. bolletii]SKT28398.1 Uncharacterised protein [Mycobacteroides abscessus subsp. bolletii]SKT32944.1 Uncharacterised protein [Mycobacteroides abscessus subsp. bolletii]SLD66094.1 Uncharacterised protein [Mycobacteroides abscessus subsp. bolletii]